MGYASQYSVPFVEQQWIKEVPKPEELLLVGCSGRGGPPKKTTAVTRGSWKLAATTRQPAEPRKQGSFDSSFGACRVATLGVARGRWVGVCRRWLNHTRYN